MCLYSWVCSHSLGCGWLVRVTPLKRLTSPHSAAERSSVRDGEDPQLGTGSCKLLLSLLECWLACLSYRFKLCAHSRVPRTPTGSGHSCVFIMTGGVVGFHGGGSHIGHIAWPFRFQLAWDRYDGCYIQAEQQYCTICFIQDRGWHCLVFSSTAEELAQHMSTCSGNTRSCRRCRGRRANLGPGWSHDGKCVFIEHLTVTLGYNHVLQTAFQVRLWGLCIQGTWDLTGRQVPGIVPIKGTSPWQSLTCRQTEHRKK